VSCFYCAGAEVISNDVGSCEGKCAKHVCVAGTAARPNDYHADRCGCGCAKLICIFDMQSHVEREHQSTTPGDCFPNSAAHAGLAAGEAIERSGEFDQDTSVSDKDRYGRSIYRLLEIVPVRDSFVPKSLGVALDEEGLAGRLFTSGKWERMAAALAPYVVLTIARYWPKVNDQELEARVDNDFQRRLERFLGSGYSDSKRLPQNGTSKGMLQAWFDFSPRLATLILQHGSPKTEVFDALVPGLPGFGILPTAPWSSYPRRLELHELAVAGMARAPRGGTATGHD
jgi:hypothetical protein